MWVPSSEADYCRFDRHPPRFRTQSARVVSAMDWFRILSANSRRRGRTSSGYCSFAYSALASFRMGPETSGPPQERPKRCPMEPQCSTETVLPLSQFLRFNHLPQFLLAGIQVNLIDRKSGGSGIWEKICLESDVIVPKRREAAHSAKPETNSSHTSGQRCGWEDRRLHGYRISTPEYRIC